MYMPYLMDTHTPMIRMLYLEVQIPSNSRRIWQKKEDDVLMASTMHLIAQKWRNENGQFKPGFFPLLEEKLKETFPETDLCAYPHIESKVKLWKRHYYAVYGMLQTSGFGWNDTDKTVLVDIDQVWENYLKKDANVKGLRNKPFPYYDNWCVLSGKDRATGDLAEGPVESVAAMDEEEDQTNNNPNSVPLANDMNCSIDGTPSRRAEAGSSSSRKRSCNETISTGLASIEEQLGTFFEQTNARMNEMAQRIGYSHDLSLSRRMVDDMLQNLPLDLESRLQAGSMIVRNAHVVDMFFSLRERDRAKWVEMLLAGKIVI